jgi:hypothetical protein
MTNVLYETSCEHLLACSTMAVPAGTFRCRNCGGDSRVTGVQIMEYRARCADCNWTRYTGMSQPMANGAATRHCISTSHRRITVGWAVNQAAKKERDRLLRGGLL